MSCNMHLRKCKFRVRLPMITNPFVATPKAVGPGNYPMHVRLRDCMYPWD
jgi:hypothetical protein